VTGTPVIYALLAHWSPKPPPKLDLPASTGQKQRVILAHRAPIAKDWGERSNCDRCGASWSCSGVCPTDTALAAAASSHPNPIRARTPQTALLGHTPRLPEPSLGIYGPAGWRRSDGIDHPVAPPWRFRPRGLPEGGAPAAGKAGWYTAAPR